MAGIAANLDVSLPLALDDGDGFHMIKDPKTLFAQDIKTIVLTNPGELCMDSRFGAGVAKLLFEPLNGDLHSRVRAAISSQISKYMPAIRVEKIDVEDVEGGETAALNIRVNYRVATLGIMGAVSIFVRT